MDNSITDFFRRMILPTDRPQSTIEMVLGILVIEIVLMAIDFLFARKTKARWFFLHAAANLMVVLSGLYDFYIALSDPFNQMVGPYSQCPLYCIAAIHIYHLVFFNNLNKADIIHHVVFAGVICCMGFFARWGPIQGVVAFFLSGFPGGIDYVLLVMVAHGKLERERERELNARINLWIRGPGCSYSAFAIMHGIISGNMDAHPLFAACVALLCFINGQYYSGLVVGTTYRKVEDFNVS